MIEFILVLVALTILVGLGIVHSPGNLLPGLEGVLESQTSEVTFTTDGANPRTFAVTFAGDFTNTTPAIFTDAYVTRQDANGDVTATSAHVTVNTATSDGCTVEVGVDALPTVSGETADVTVAIMAAGGVRQRGDP